MKLLQPSVREIHTFIDKKAQELGITIAWEYNDVYNIFRSSPGARLHDATNLLEYLAERKELTGLAYEASLDETGRLQAVFFEIEGGTDFYAATSFESARAQCALQYDTTWGTNTWGMKLGCFTTVNPDGSTRILAGSIIMQETTATFEWTFSAFFRVFKMSRSSSSPTETQPSPRRS
mmetsp:Transcript_17612/g.43805  ORF Transcript_17612/g.43805 Transcript_17612/m.43805 type:complete len:178 (-) Transcript_17612:811-1344(-)